MSVAFHVVGECQFTTTAKRNSAETLLNADATAKSMVASTFGSWRLAPTLLGTSRLTVNGRAALRFSYRTTDKASADAFVANFASRYGVDSDAWWSTHAVEEPT